MNEEYPQELLRVYPGIALELSLYNGTSPHLGKSFWVLIISLCTPYLSQGCVDRISLTLRDFEV